MPRANLPSAAVHAVYASAHDDRLLVIDKDNGGKADSLNCGIRYAAYPLFCAIDADTLLDPAALARLVWSFLAEPETVATGGIVRIVNGSLLEDGRLKVRTPRSLLVNVQIVEYLRAFLAGRTGWSRLNMLLIISGAFGLFRRETVVEAGGYDTTTVGEDTELIVRLHRHCRDLKGRYKITFVADPICWTEAPGDAAAGGLPARPLAARPAGDAVAPSRHVHAPALRSHRHARAAVLPLLRGTRPAGRDHRAHVLHRRPGARMGEPGRRRDRPRAGVHLRAGPVLRRAADGGPRVRPLPRLARHGAPDDRRRDRELRLPPVALPRADPRDVEGAAAAPRLGRDDAHRAHRGRPGPRARGHGA